MDSGVLREVVDRATLASRVSELGNQIGEEYEGRVPVMLAILTGAVPFLADLVRAMDIELQVDFLALSRFGEGGRVRIAMDTELSLTDRHVVIVEDIVDTGLSLSVLRRLIGARIPASVATATLLDKATRRIVDVPLEYRGFEIGDEFLLGYGLDWEGRYRNLRSLWSVLDLARFQDDPNMLARGVYTQGGDRLFT